jgi:hypothetical protein
LDSLQQARQLDTLSKLETLLEASCGGDLPIAHRLELSWLADELCHSSKALGEPATDGTAMNEVIKSLRRLKANLKRRKYARDQLTSARLMELPEEARAILLSSVAYIFRDAVDGWAQIDFGNDDHVAMLELSVASSLAKLTNPQGRPANESLDAFFIGLRNLYEDATGTTAVAGAHYDGNPRSDFETLMYLGYQLIRPAQSYASALKAWERAIARDS